MNSFWKQFLAMLGWTNNARGSSKRYQKKDRGIHKFRPTIELLEDRLVPANFVVPAPGGVGNVAALIADIASANAQPGSTITLSTGTYSLTSELSITANMTITSQTGVASSVTLLATTESRIFEISQTNATTPTFVTLTGLTIEGGAVLGSNGGGILVDQAADQLILNNDVVTGNTATAASQHRRQWRRHLLTWRGCAQQYLSHQQQRGGGRRRRRRLWRRHLRRRRGHPYQRQCRERQLRRRGRYQ